MRVDILTSRIDVAGEMEFTAVTPGANFIALIPPGVNGLAFRNSNGEEYFEAGDNLLLQKIWFTIPYGFGQGPGIPVLEMRWQNSLGTVEPIGAFNIASSIYVPSICESLEFPDTGLFLEAPKTLGNIRLLLQDNTALNVSMVNLPTTLNGVLVKVQVNLQVAHTRPML